jgi:hypothetical protein
LILQEKENDIKGLLKEIDLIKKQGLKSADLRVYDNRNNFFEKNNDNDELSLSERHILEVLSKKRRAV